MTKATGVVVGEDGLGRLVGGVFIEPLERLTASGERAVGRDRGRRAGSASSATAPSHRLGISFFGS